MQKIHFSVFINAPKEKVWNTMLNKETYNEWTKAFNPSSTYVGSWEEGSEIRFVGSNSEAEGESGMYSRIKENRLHEFLSIEHLGMIENGVIDTTSEKVKAWLPAFENYTFKETEGGTELTIDIDTTDEYKSMFEEMWPKALEVLKALSEHN
jgi:L-rhamnose mutarotase